MCSTLAWKANKFKRFMHVFNVPYSVHTIALKIIETLNRDKREQTKMSHICVRLLCEHAMRHKNGIKCYKVFSWLLDICLIASIAAHTVWICVCVCGCVSVERDRDRKSGMKLEWNRNYCITGSEDFFFVARSIVIVADFRRFIIMQLIQLLISLRNTIKFE